MVVKSKTYTAVQENAELCLEKYELEKYMNSSRFFEQRDKMLTFYKIGPLVLTTHRDF